jgi:hypothetical protein
MFRILITLGEAMTLPLIVLVSLAAAVLGLATITAHADVITLDVSASMLPVSPGAACAPTGCTLGGDIVINNSSPAPGIVISADVTAAGFSPNVGPFTVYTAIAALSDGLTSVEIENPTVDVLGLLILEFPTPTAGSLVGYTGGAISTGTSVFGPGEPIAAIWEVTAGSLSERVPEPSSLLVLIAGLAATCGILGKRLLSKANGHSQLCS